MRWRGITPATKPMFMTANDCPWMSPFWPRGCDSMSCNRGASSLSEEGRMSSTLPWALKAYQSELRIICGNLFSYPVKETSRFPQHPPPFCELDLALLQCLVAVVQRRYSLLEVLAPLCELVNLGCRGGCQDVGEFMLWPHGYRLLFDLASKVPYDRCKMMNLNACGNRAYEAVFRHCRVSEFLG